MCDINESLWTAWKIGIDWAGSEGCFLTESQEDKNWFLTLQEKKIVL